MSIKNKIKFKKPIEEKKEELHEKDRPRYEEQSVVRDSSKDGKTKKEYLIKNTKKLILCERRNWDADHDKRMDEKKVFS